MLGNDIPLRRPTWKKAGLTKSIYYISWLSTSSLSLSVWELSPDPSIAAYRSMCARWWWRFRGSCCLSGKAVGSDSNSLRLLRRLRLRQMLVSLRPRKGQEIFSLSLFNPILEVNYETFLNNTVQMTLPNYFFQNLIDFWQVLELSKTI